MTKNISMEMLKDIGMVVPRIMENKVNTNIHVCMRRQATLITA